MGYRHRFAIVPKSIYLTVKGMTPEQLKAWVLKNHPEGWYDEGDGNGWFSHYLMLGQKEIFDFGKDCWFAADLLEQAQPLFTRSETVDAVGNPLVVCTREDFEFVIEEMRKHIHNYFENIFETYTPEQMQLHFKEKSEEWGNITDIVGMRGLTPERAAIINAQHRPYNMDLHKDCLVNSWLYEYEIFELVLTYRQFDWDNSTLLFYGW